ncbi:MAG: hypothetical protein JWM87_2027 [Candidatus Eremiobacteraeota bacterium]|nr:hypothetical protein [Candidatus Eremiobacteraeota bacterium]
MRSGVLIPKERAAAFSPASSRAPGTSARAARSSSHDARPELGLPVQAKLEVGSVDDPLEDEADRVAEHVMRMPDPAWHIGASGPKVSRTCDGCAAERGGAAAPQLVQEVAGSPGRALDASARAFFEPRFGHDFSRVRVHTDDHAAESARSVGALAYTVGPHIVFGENRYDPSSASGSRLLAHELAHAVQQGGAAGSPVVQRQAAPARPATPHLGSCRPVQDDLRPTAPWADLQRGYRRRCGAAVADVTGQLGSSIDDLLHGRMPRTPHLPDARSTVDCACANLGPKEAAWAAAGALIIAGPLATRLYAHFLGASGTPMTIDVADMIARSAGVRAKILTAIGRGGRSGTTRLEQDDYGIRDLQFAYGAIDCVQWEALPPAAGSWRRNPATRIRVSMLDYYEFHPDRLGVSQCAHAACVESVARGDARNFWTSGVAVVRLSDLQP